MTKQEILQAIQDDIATKTQTNSITPAILAQIIVDAVSLAGNIKYDLDIAGTICNGQVSTITIPEGITEIVNDAFRELIEIEEVILPSTLTTIGSYAFQNNLLKTVTIPDSVTSIDLAAFAINKISSLTLNSSITVYPSGTENFGTNNGVFDSNLLTSLVIPVGVTEIGSYVFANNLLTSLTLPNTVVLIKDFAFLNNSLTSVDVPTGCVVEANAFDGGVTVNFV